MDSEMPMIICKGHSGTPMHLQSPVMMREEQRGSEMPLCSYAPRLSCSETEENMAGQIVTITSGKGGVGKTTTTANLAVALARRGLRVACIDADIGLRNLDVVLGLENRIVYDLVDVVEGRARLRQALIKDKRFPELQLLPAAQTRDKSAVNEKQMVEVSAALKKEFDFVFIDSPAGIEHGFKNALAPADRVLIVTTPEVSA